MISARHWHTAAGGVTLLTAPALSAQPGVGHFFSTRHGGVSTAPYAGLNLALHLGDDPAAVRANRARLAHALGLSPAQLVFAQQVHGARVAEVTASLASLFSSASAAARPAADALITAQPGICLMVLVADCVPLLLVDMAGRAVGAAHAGWRGTVMDVAGATVRAMVAAFGCDPAEMAAAIGPSIAPADYEIGPEVVSAVQEVFPALHPALLSPTRPGHAQLDLWAANRAQLIHAGLRAEHVHVTGPSTARAVADFYSVRGEGGSTGRFAGGVWLAAPGAAATR